MQVMQKMQVQSLGQKDPMQEEMAQLYRMSCRSYTEWVVAVIPNELSQHIQKGF